MFLHTNSKLPSEWCLELLTLCMACIYAVRDGQWVEKVMIEANLHSYKSWAELCKTVRLANTKPFYDWLYGLSLYIAASAKWGSRSWAAQQWGEVIHVASAVDCGRSQGNRFGCLSPQSATASLQPSPLLSRCNPHRSTFHLQTANENQIIRLIFWHVFFKYGREGFLAWFIWTNSFKSHRKSYTFGFETVPRAKKHVWAKK